MAGGCFWGMEEILRAIPGVLSTEVRTGGRARAPHLRRHPRQQVGPCRVGEGGVRSPAASRGTAREVFFACTTQMLNRQGSNDAGTQYRSAIFDRLIGSGRSPSR
ncbi:MAG: peptide-methionine (S)-S-oxide reductase [Candidatus Binatia bacterium]